jgi:hypothetical protein
VSAASPNQNLLIRWDPVQLPAQQLAEIIQCLKGGAGPSAGAEKRQSSRLEIQANVVVAPLTGPGKIGKPLNTLTRDISFTGIGLLNTIPMEKETLFVIRFPRLNKASLLVLAKVMHCRQLADSLYAIGAEYVEVMESEHQALDPKVDPKAKADDKAKESNGKSTKAESKAKDAKASNADEKSASTPAEAKPAALTETTEAKAPASASDRKAAKQAK